MAKISFFIGNGFDINVGLDTRYKDFYKYYISENPEDKLALAISNDYEYWADLEEGLGKYTASIKDEEVTDFWESEDLLEQSLADYLELQMARVQVDSEEEKAKIAKIMQDSLNKFYVELPKEQRQSINNIIGTLHESITYSFISFNYTNVLDTCVQVTKECIPSGFGAHRAGASMYNHEIGTVLHIHGTTTEEMIVGVNDISQIANEEFREKPLFCELLIKAAANQRFSQNKIKEVQEIIDSSVIICLFGMSIGKTDRMWWERICKWLKGSINRRLIIYAKKDMRDVKRITKRMLFLSQNDVLEKLEMNSGLEIEEWNAIRGRIYIKFDTDIFGFDFNKKMPEDSSAK